MKESPACVWSRRQKGILRLTALERGRQAFISPNYDMIAENERQGSMWQTKGAGVCPEEKMANHSVMFFGDVSFTFWLYRDVVDDISTTVNWPKNQCLPRVFNGITIALKEQGALSLVLIIQTEIHHRLAAATKFLLQSSLQTPSRHRQFKSCFLLNGKPLVLHSQGALLLCLYRPCFLYSSFRGPSKIGWLKWIMAAFLSVFG